MRELYYVYSTTNLSKNIDILQLHGKGNLWHKSHKINPELDCESRRAEMGTDSVANPRVNRWP